LIRNILKNPSTASEIKSRVNSILYKKYYEYTINKAYSFSKYNKIKHNNKISANELSNYALRGLYKAIIRYNATYTFINHLDLYIQYELYTGYKELYPINDLVSYIQNNKRCKTDVMEKHIREHYVKNEDNLDYYNEIDIISKIKDMGVLYYEIYKLKYNNQM
jgi:hypothetical protein